MFYSLSRSPTVHDEPMTIHGIIDPSVAEAVRCSVKLLWASRAVSRHVEPRLAAAGLTLTQLEVLEAVLHEGPMTHRDLGCKVLTSASNMTYVVDKLALRGLVLRVRAVDDRRLVRGELTTPGRTLIEELLPLHASDIARAIGDLDSADLEQLGGLLRKLGISIVQLATDRIRAGSPDASHLAGGRSTSNDNGSDQ
jgi:MarR family 2-MHQ and catechol resistance regulon transcriptional repressor